MNSDVTDKLLAEREKTHGKFESHASVTQQLKSVIRESVNYEKLTFVQCEAIEMILHKVGRVLAGNANTKDHWDDIAGYARLASRAIQEDDNVRS